ncbi:putative oxidoreductase YteT [Thalassobacillus devorans]|uniref:Oxidoreductase YteT n=1 Tax=Thalassobacillus devorans TaxID=279813 RepID=A0ABQ1NSR8_9BACI|nr:Gfo/Idh/MocA family oxidoreductase [Thalassobacillus devorans]NIK28732.1 putative dehydrogenase [Thalassobacillus devorans]GGC83986.1 putative oxidoreductase YteT [Thalassobacillus devorans]
MRKFAVCGVSKRAIDMFIQPMITTFSSTSKLVGLLDTDPKRFVVCKSKFPETENVPEYGERDFEKMIVENKPDVIIVASRDDTHIEYILKALEYDLDVISEKPMTTTAADSRRVMEAEVKSKGKVTVTFNYRYSPHHMRIKELINEGKVGRVTSVDLNWYIDTYHGSSYFQRWNRKREFSGGLSIHKSSHHFDLVNWWLDQKPEEVFAFGALNYYGPESEHNPLREDGRHCKTCDVKHDCSYYTRWNSRSNSAIVRDDHIDSDEARKDGYTNYRPDQCVFDSDIEIEDTYTATVKYDKGALLSYSINFSLPYEGYRLAINGTKGRIETTEFHAPSRVPFTVPEQTIEYFPLFGSKETIHVVQQEGGHGGGDPVIQEDLFMGEDPRRKYKVLSGSEDGAYAVTTGEAVWKSAKENRSVRIEDLINQHTASN